MTKNNNGKYNIIMVEKHPEEWRDIKENVKKISEIARLVIKKTPRCRAHPNCKTALRELQKIAQLDKEILKKQEYKDLSKYYDVPPTKEETQNLLDEGYTVEDVPVDILTLQQWMNLKLDRLACYYNSVKTNDESIYCLNVGNRKYEFPWDEIDKFLKIMREMKTPESSGSSAALIITIIIVVILVVAGFTAWFFLSGKLSGFRPFPQNRRIGGDYYDPSYVSDYPYVYDFYVKS